MLSQKGKFVLRMFNIRHETDIESMSNVLFYQTTPAPVSTRIFYIFAHLYGFNLRIHLHRTPDTKKMVDVKGQSFTEKKSNATINCIIKGLYCIEHIEKIIL